MKGNLKIMRIISISSMVLLAMLLTACGGGGGTSTPTVTDGTGDTGDNGDTIEDTASILITKPLANVTNAEEATIEICWIGTSSDGATVSLYYDTDADYDNEGYTSLGDDATSLAVTGCYDWGISDLNEGTYYILSVISTDSLSGYDYSDVTITIGTGPTIIITDVASLSVTIGSPADNSTHTTGDSISFEGTSSNSDASLTWYSSIDGKIGTSEEVEVSTLSTGEHDIVLVAEESSSGDVSADLITITVVDAEPNILNVPSEYVTIEEAIDAAEEGDTIRIAAGTYNEQDLRVFGGLTIEGESAESTIIRGFGNGYIIHPTHHYADRTKVIVIKKVTIENGARGIYSYGDILELTDCIVHNNNNLGIYLSESVATISHCKIADNSGDGVRGGTVTIADSIIKNNVGDGVFRVNGTITNSVIKNNTGNGIEAYEKSITITNTIIANNRGDGIRYGDMDISYCTIYGNDDGIYAAVSSSGPIKNSIVAMNSDYGIYLYDSSLNDVSNINFYDNSECNLAIDLTCYIGSLWYDAIDSILTDPMFVDAANGDFHLQEGSPALTASDTGGEIGAYGNGGNPPD